MPKQEREHIGKVKLLQTSRLFAMVLEPVPDNEEVLFKLAQVQPLLWPTASDDGDQLMVAYSQDEFGSSSIEPEKALRNYGKTVARLINYKLIKTVVEFPPSQAQRLHNLAFPTDTNL